MDTLFMMRGIMATSGKTGTYHMMKLQLIRDGKEIPLPKDFNNKIYMVYNNVANLKGQNDLNKKSSYNLDWVISDSKDAPNRILIKGAGGGGVEIHATYGCWGLEGCNGLSYKIPPIEGRDEDFENNLLYKDTYQPIIDIKEIHDKSREEAISSGNSFKFILKTKQPIADGFIPLKLWVPKQLKNAIK